MSIILNPISTGVYKNLEVNFRTVLSISLNPKRTGALRARILKEILEYLEESCL